MKNGNGYSGRLSTPRVRVSRARRDQGLRCITVVLHGWQVGHLVHKGLLRDEDRSDRAAVGRALEGYLHEALMPRTEFLKELYSRPLGLDG